MIIVLKQGTTQQEIDTVTNAVVARGVSVSPIVGTEMTILGLTGDTSRIDPDQLESFHCVERIMKVAPAGFADLGGRRVCGGPHSQVEEPLSE